MATITLPPELLKNFSPTTKTAITQQPVVKFDYDIPGAVTLPKDLVQVKDKLPFETRGTFSDIPTIQFRQDYQVPKMNILKDVGVVSSALISGSGKLAEAGVKKTFSTLAPSYTGFNYQIPEFPVYTRSTAIDVRSSMQDPFVIKGRQVKALSPEEVAGAVNFAVSTGTALTLYSQPYTRVPLLASGLASGVEAAQIQIPKFEDVKITPEEKIRRSDLEKDGQVVRDEDWQQYEKDYNRYIEEVNAANKIQKENIQKLKLQRALGYVEVGASSLFLASDIYRAATKPLVIRGGVPRTESVFEAKVLPTKPGRARIEIISYTPGREYIKTNPVKEILFWSSGKRLDLAQQVRLPGTLRLTTADLLLSKDKTLGVTSSVKAGTVRQAIVKIPVSPVETPLGIQVQPDLQASLKFLRRSKPRVIKPMEFRAKRIPTDLSGLSKPEKLLLERLSGGPTPKETFTGKNFEFFTSEAELREGIPVGRGIRLTKASPKFSELFIPSRPPTPSELDRSLQLSKLTLKPIETSDIAETFRIEIASKPLTGTFPAATGKVSVIPGKVSVLKIPSEKIGSNVNIFLRPSKSSRSTLIKEAAAQNLVVREAEKIQQIRRVGEVAGSLAAQTTKVSSIPRAPKIESALETLSFTVESLKQTPDIAQAQPVLMAQSPQEINREAIVENERITEIPSIIPREVERLREFLIPARALVNPQISTQSPAQITVPVPVTTPPSGFPGTPSEPIPFLEPPEEEEEQKKKKRKKKITGPGFEVQIKRKGKFKIFNGNFSYPEQEAVAIGAEEVLKTPSATFRIRPSNKPLRATGKLVPSGFSQLFRRPKSGEARTFVQVKRERIRSPGEIAGISLVGARTRRTRARNIFFR